MTNNSPFKSKLFKRTAVVAVAAAVLAGAATPAVAHGPAQSRPELQRTAQDMVDYGLLGVQMRVHDGQGDWTGSAGASTLGGDRAPRTDGSFRIGSGTKAFAATVVLQLVDEGRVGLDSPAVEYLPQFDLDPRITVRMLLQHTSGVFNHAGEYYGGVFQPGIPTDGKAWVDDRFASYAPEDLVRFSLSKGLMFEPGTAWDYSNTNYVLARLLVENVTGKSFEGAMRERILAPLGLRDTVVPGAHSTNIPGPHAHGYMQYDDNGTTATVDVSRQNPSYLSTGGDMISSTRDLQTFLSALLGARLLSESSLAAMLTPDPKSPNMYGLGVEMQDMGADCGGRIVSINGFINGYAQLTYATVDAGTTVSVSANIGDVSFADMAAAGAKAMQRVTTEVFC